MVSITAVEPCEECEWCRLELRMHCDNRRNIGTGRDGGFAEYMVIPAKQAFHIPEGVSLDTAALCEPLACVVRGVIERTRVSAGDYVLVAGCGIMGQLTALVAKAAGAVIAVIPDQIPLSEDHKEGVSVFSDLSKVCGLL